MRETRLNILLVVEGAYPWSRGGVSEWIHQYILYLSEAHFTILQVGQEPTSQFSNLNSAYRLPKNVCRFIRISPPDMQSAKKEILHSWGTSAGKRIKEEFEKCHVVHVTSCGYSGWLGATMAKQVDKPLILTEHAIYWKEIKKGVPALECGYRLAASGSHRKKFVQLFQKIARDVYGSADKIISVSRVNIPFQKALGAVSPIYIPNGFEEEWFNIPRRPAKLPFTIGWVGRCSSLKDPIKFFHFMEAYQKWNSDTKFIMVSCDANEPALSRTVKMLSKSYPQLSLIWNQPAKKHYQGMNALCVTSRSESQPLVIFEALAQRVLPIGWEVGDAKSQYGLFLPQNASVHELAKQVLTLWQKKNAWEKEVNKRVNYIRDHHTWSLVFRQYRKILNRSRSQRYVN